MTSPTLSEVIVQAQQVRSAANAAFGSLSSEQINWKPSPGEWSIAQCLEHLILLNKPYFPQIEAIVAGERRATLWERLPLLPGIFGRLILAAVQPESKQKVTARPAFKPVSSPIDVGILSRFSTQQDDLIRLMKATAELPIHEIILTSVVSPVVTYSLFDAYHILVAHERRHLQQAQRLMLMQGFPQRS
jgi:hypothetical protein